jgi:hypothetical protein
MADEKISASPLDATPARNVLIPIVSDPSGTPANEHTTAADLVAVAKIEEQTPSGVGTITFSSLGTFTHLEIRYSARSTIASASEDMLYQFNGDTAGNYDVELLYNSSATAAASAEVLASTGGNIGNLPGASATANRAGVGTINIYDYRGTTFNKSVTADNGNALGTASGQLTARIWTGTWRSTAAITSIRLFIGSGNYVAGSKFTLYGYQ